MGKLIISFNDIIEINHALEDNGIKFKVHLHDACGCQSFTVEPLGNCACEGHFDEMKNEITRYFENKRIKIRFLENNLDFIVVQ